MKELKELRVGLITPSTPVAGDEFLETILTLQGIFRYLYLPNYINQNLGGYMAGTGEQRAADIHESLENEDVDALLCIRGGYSSSQVLPFLDKALIKKYKKPVIGYSDVTNLHLFFHRLGVPTVHGPMGYSNLLKKRDEYTIRSLEKALFAKGSYLFENGPGKSLRHYREGTAEGILFGGNLSLLSDAKGTPYEAEGEGKILFLEEVDAPLPAVDRMLTGLKHAGLFDSVEGVILGDFTNCGNQYTDDYTLDDLFSDFFKDYPKPVIGNFTSGHGETMGSMAFGKKCVIGDEGITLEGLGL